MRKTIDNLKTDGRKLYRTVTEIGTHSINLTFLCGISKKKDQLMACAEVKSSLNGDNDIRSIAGKLSDCRIRYRDIGCVGYSLEHK